MVMINVRSPRLPLSGEATWVLTNAISSLREGEDLMGFLTTFGKDLVHSLCHWLEEKAAKGEPRLTLEVLKSLSAFL